MHWKDGVVTAHFELEGLQQFQIISEDPDGSLWVALRASDAPLCHVTDSAVKCFGKDDGIPISSVNSLLADGKGGFWLGGEANFSPLACWSLGDVQRGKTRPREPGMWSRWNFVAGHRTRV